MEFSIDHLGVGDLVWISDDENVCELRVLRECGWEGGVPGGLGRRGLQGG
jgi:hypothetical protein